MRYQQEIIPQTRISAEELKDYQICARLYDYRHRQKIKESLDIRERRALRFDESIGKVASFFFYKKQSNSEPSYQALQNRWQKIWFSEDTRAADLAIMKNEVAWMNDISYTSQAVSSLLVFYEDFAGQLDQEVVLIDEDFLVPFTGNTCLTGKFDLVTRRRKPNGHFRYDIYKWIVVNHKKSISFWITDLAFLDIAFRSRMKGKPVDVRYHLWNFGSYLPGDKEVIVETEDIDTIRYWTQSLDNDKIFMNRRGMTSYCKSCPFDKPCLEWKIK